VVQRLVGMKPTTPSLSTSDLTYASQDIVFITTSSAGQQGGH